MRRAEARFKSEERWAEAGKEDPLWVKAKQLRLGRPITIREATFDFNLGYFTAIFTAICFVALGTYVMFSPLVPLEKRPSLVLKYWSYCTIATLTVVSLISVYLKATI